jgi:hypothetical protein
MTTAHRVLYACVVAVACPLAPALAHHSYGAFDACKPISLEGEISKVEWVNPHIVIELRTQDVASYRIEWFALNQLATAEIATGTLQTGDRVVISGAPMRDANLKVLSLLSEIRRPSDGWRWARERPRPQSCAAQ